MKVKGILSVITIMPWMTVLGSSQPYQVGAIRYLSVQNQNRADQVEILNATLQIEMTVPLDGDSDRFVRAKGLGSLVWDGEETLLVTHNHWGDVLRDYAMIDVYDAHGQLLKALSGAKFKSLARYQDAGTLMLRSPVEWKGQAQPAIEGDYLRVRTGDHVWVAQRASLKRREVVLVEAEVKSITTLQGLSVFRLRGMEGQPVQPGDSGGGVWHDGSLVANLYATIMVRPSLLIPLFLKPDEADLKMTNESYVAAIGSMPQLTETYKSRGESGVKNRPDKHLPRQILKESLWRAFLPVKELAALLKREPARQA